MITVTISLFGALRQYEPQAAIQLQCAAHARISEVRLAIVEYAKHQWPTDAQHLLAACALASEYAVLRDDEMIPENLQLALLPPVSGG